MTNEMSPRDMVHAFMDAIVARDREKAKRLARRVRQLPSRSKDVYLGSWLELNRAKHPELVSRIEDQLSEEKRARPCCGTIRATRPGGPGLPSAGGSWGSDDE